MANIYISGLFGGFTSSYAEEKLFSSKTVWRREARPTGCAAPKEQREASTSHAFDRASPPAWVSLLNLPPLFHTSLDKDEEPSDDLFQYKLANPLQSPNPRTQRLTFSRRPRDGVTNLSRPAQLT